MGGVSDGNHGSEDHLSDLVSDVDELIGLHSSCECVEIPPLLDDFRNLLCKDRKNANVVGLKDVRYVSRDSVNDDIVVLVVLMQLFGVV